MAVQVIINELNDIFAEDGTSLKEKMNIVIRSASNMEVLGEEHFRQMTGLYAESKSWEKKIEFLRKEANAPDQRRIDERNDRAKEILVPLKRLQAIAQEKCAAYQALLEQKKRSDEAKIQAALDLLGLDDVPLPAPIEKTIRGDRAMMYSRTVRKFKLTDLKAVPMQYLQLNEDAVEKAIKLGVGSIPGVEIYEEQITQLRTR